MLAEITRTYGGQEGRRVKAGTRFAVGVEVEGLRTISPTRFQQLKTQRLAKEVDATSMAAAPAAKPAPTPRRGTAPTPANKVEPPSKPRPTRARSNSRKRTQEDAPGEPRPLDRRQAGGPAGKEAASSSSEEARQVGSLTLKQRGNRRQASAGSPSTTPVSLSKAPAAPTSRRGSRRGPMSSTPATEGGGGSSGASQNSEVLD